MEQMEDEYMGVTGHKLFLKQLVALIVCGLCIVGGLAAQDSANKYQQLAITPNNASQLVEVAFQQGNSRTVNQVEFSSPLDEHALNINLDENDTQSGVILLDPDFLTSMSDALQFLTVPTIAFSPDRDRLAVVDQRSWITIFDTASLNPLITIEAETEAEPIMNVAIDSQNRYLAVAVGAPERVPLASFVFRLFELATGQELFSLARETTDIDEVFGTGVDFSKDGDFVYLSTSDGLVYQWHVATGEQKIVGEGAAPGSRILVHTSNDLMAYLTQDGFRTIDKDGMERDFLASPNLVEKSWWLMGTITAHPSQPLVAIGYIVPSESNTTPDTRDSVVQVWDIEEGELRFETMFTDLWPHNLVDLAFSPDGTLLASGGTDGTVRLWGVPGE